MDPSKVLHHAHALMKLGMNRAAEELVILLDGATNESDGYRDGIEDALLTLIQHGATDPR